MDLRQLRALLAVAEHQNFSAAARALHTVQSNISTHVSRLEHEMGVVLIDRATNTLTEEGRVVADRARRIEAEFSALESDVAALRDEIRGRVRIGVIGTTARWIVPPLLGALSERHPAISLLVLDATTSSLVPQLVSGQIDLAVVNTPISEPDVTVQPLFDEELLVVAPVGHPLAGREQVSLAELAAFPLLLEAPGTSFREDIDAQAAAVGVELQAQAEFDGMRLLASLAFTGFGAAILPASAAPTPPAGVDAAWTKTPISGVTRRSVGLARRRRGLPSAAERAVVEVLIDVIDNEAPLEAGIEPARPSASR